MMLLFAFTMLAENALELGDDSTSYRTSKRFGT